MFDFSKLWTDEIAEVTTDEEYQNAEVILKDASAKAEYDVDTGEYTYPDGQPNLYQGRARLVVVRWGVYSGGESQANAKVASSVRIQFPKHAVGRIQRANTVIVVSCDDNPAIDGSIYNVFSGTQGSAAASRTIEAQLDGDSNQF